MSGVGLVFVVWWCFKWPRPVELGAIAIARHRKAEISVIWRTMVVKACPQRRIQPYLIPQQHDGGYGNMGAYAPESIAFGPCSLYLDRS